MRDYSKISAAFWTGETGRSLRGDLEAQVLALYLISSPHSNMEGVFYCPIMFMSHETGIPLEGASKALHRLIEAGFCTYDTPSEVVFVHEMAAHQIGPSLKPHDNMVKAIRATYRKMPKGNIRHCFFNKYGAAYHLNDEDDDATPSEPPSDPLRSTETKTETKTEKEKIKKKTSEPGFDDAGFQRFWERYPHKMGKQEAMKAFGKLKPDSTMLDEILAGLERYIASKPAWQEWKHPGPWLNQRRWEDQPTKTKPRDYALDEWMAGAI